MKKLKICLVSRKFDKNSGSAEWIYADFLKENLSKKDFLIYIIEQKNVNIKSSIYKKMFYDFVILPIKLILIRLKGVKKIFFLSENQAIYVPLLHFLGGKTYIYFHDLMRIKSMTNSLDKKYFLFVYKQAAKGKEIICNSSFTKEDLIRVLNIDYKKIKIIPPIYREFYSFKKKKRNKRFVIGYLGSLTKRKRPFFFVKLAKEIKKKKIKDLFIEIWGRGDESSKIKKENLSTISLKGFAPEESLEKIYNTFDFFVFPSEYEGFGLPILEALMCGIPVFVLEDSKIPTGLKKLTEICKNEKDLLDKILFLIKNKEGYEKLSKQAIANSKKFNKEDNLNKIKNILRK